MKQLNFGHNVTLTPRSRYTPQSEQEVIEILEANKGRRIRCIGRLHSWSEAVQCEDVLLDLRHLNDVQLIAEGDSARARVGGGCQIKRLLAELEKRGWTLPSVGFITEQSVAGAISTGTHGSGRHSLSHYVTSIRVARYDRRSGKAVVEEIATGEELRAARCSFGCTGVILSVTIECRSPYRVEEYFQEYESLSEVFDAEQNFPLQQFYLVPWRWTYIVQHRREVVAPNSPAAWLYKWYRFITLDIAMHLLIFIAVRIVRVHAGIRILFRRVLPVFVIRNCRVVADSTTQLVMEHELFRHVEIELFVQRDRLEAALKFLRESLCGAGDETSECGAEFLAQLRETRFVEEFSRLRGAYCHHYPICVRKILPDDTLISMASNAGYGAAVETPGSNEHRSDQAWYSITLTNYHRGSNREPFEELASFLAKSMALLFAARPHWGKLCPLSTEDFRNLYPAMDRFREVCVDADPDGVFRNQWSQTMFQNESVTVE